MNMDTLQAAEQLQASGVPQEQARAIARVMNDFGRADLVTKEYLDMRLWQLTVTIIGSVLAINGSFLAIAGLFKLFG